MCYFEIIIIMHLRYIKLTILNMISSNNKLLLLEYLLIKLNYVVHLKGLFAQFKLK